MSNNHISICVGHYLTTSERKSRMGYDDWYEKTYSTFKVDTFRPKAGISYIPISCKVCEKPFKIKLMSKGREFTIRFALAFFGIAGISIAFMSSIDLGFRYFGGIGGALAFCFSFMQKEQFAIRLVSENPDGKHAIIYKKKF